MIYFRLTFNVKENNFFYKNASHKGKKSKGVLCDRQDEKEIEFLPTAATVVTAATVAATATIVAALPLIDDGGLDEDAAVASGGRCRPQNL